MIFPPDLPRRQREHLAADLAARIARTENDEWRAFWETELSLLTESASNVPARLQALAGSRDRVLAITVLTALGDWYRYSGADEDARGAYERALSIDASAPPAVLSGVRLAGLHNDHHRPELAILVLEQVLVAGELPEDAVQYVLTEYMRALSNSGRAAEARTFADRLIQRFPNRPELAQLAQHLLREGS